MSTREIMEAAMVAKGLDSANARAQEMMRKTALAMLNRLDAVERIEISGNAAAWQMMD